MQEDKCKVCGHVGRTVIFPGPADAGPPPQAFRLHRFDVNTAPVEQSAGFLRLGVLMRNKVFLEELKLAAGREFKAASGRRSEWQETDDHEDKSRHIIGIIGDAPVSYARWRVMKVVDVDGPAAAESDSLVVVIDRLLTLDAYRHRGFGKQTLSECLMDILHMIMLASVPVQRISMFIPVQEKCLYAAETALKNGLASLVLREFDPAGTVQASFATAGVQEFSIPAAALMSAYQAAGHGAGGPPGAAPVA